MVRSGVSKDKVKAMMTVSKCGGNWNCVDKKLGNEKFMAGAKPEVIASEEKKKADALAKIKALEESISLL